MYENMCMPMCAVKTYQRLTSFDLLTPRIQFVFFIPLVFFGITASSLFRGAQTVRYYVCVWFCVTILLTSTPCVIAALDRVDGGLRVETHLFRRGLGTKHPV